MNTQLSALSTFRERDKFSHTAFRERGLNPSDPLIIEGMEKFFNDLTDQLIAAAQQDAKEKVYKKMLKDALDKIEKDDFDTEEREMICDYFYDLANITGVDFKDQLNKWLYGGFLVNMLKMASFIKGKEKVEEVYAQSCTGCNQSLEVQVMQKQPGIPEGDWLIGQCESCKEYNLLTFGPGAKNIRFIGFHTVESLGRDEYTEEQARTRLEQIKFFR
ncbi:DUF4844 domain-containing protein [Chitinophaga qingshengii]|uniref:DUF4844 domain-containing protein n=1 Tax=Chitinophaga qingshengii TaxID=1569794 RepID=A0ABR7TSZ9_9BACT|nr:DUF4844 domain-containing protein [Chitinophaga qingshengii]MBC9933165.1 DUF4844 domain-containing protein [Chitinophaga qingshengii]